MQQIPNNDKTGIYAIENLVTGRDYIGATTISFAERWRVHQKALRAGRHSNRLLQRDWDLYGEAAFEFYIVEVVNDRRDAMDREAHWLGLNAHYCTAEETYNVIGTKTLRVNVGLLQQYRQAGRDGRAFQPTYVKLRGSRNAAFAAWKEGKQAGRLIDISNGSR